MSRTDVQTGRLLRFAEQLADESRRMFTVAAREMSEAATTSAAEEIPGIGIKGDNSY
ncbi:hypothetical protein [Streptomyces sp. NPDC002845]